MTTLATNNLTLADIVRRQDPDGSVAAVAELLEIEKPTVKDIPWLNGNLMTGHMMTVRTSLPTPYWRRLNAGVAPSKSTTSQITEACALMEAWAVIDQEEVDLNENSAAFLKSETVPFIEAMGQEFESTLFYGNSATATEEFTGFAPRYNTLGQNVISGGGSGSDNGSIWLIHWGEDSVFGIVPKNVPGGLQMRDWGEKISETTAGITGARLVTREIQFKWRTGLAIKDWRYVVRGCNIDMSDLDLAAGADLLTLMTKMTKRPPNKSKGRPAFYMNRTTEQFLDLQRTTKAGQAALSLKEVDGEEKLMFRGIPINISDSLTETEATVS